MTVIPLVRAAAVLPFAAFLEEIGAPLEKLLRDAGLSHGAPLDGEAFLPLELASSFVESAAASQGIPDLGLVVARRGGWEDLGSFGRAVGRATTLERALTLLRDTMRFHSSGAHVWFMLEGPTGRVRQRWRMRAGRFRQLDLFSTALLIDLVRRAAGHRWHPDAIDLQSAGGVDLQGDDRFAGARIRDRQPSSGITFPRHLLRRALVATGAPEPFDVRRRWLESGPPTDLPGAMRVAIRTTLVSGGPDLETAARAAGISARSMQRKLMGAGTTFSAQVERTRRERAVELLEGSRMKVVEIALELGYSDAAHFTRAFRRWTAMTPSEHRERHGAATRSLLRFA